MAPLYLPRVGAFPIFSENHPVILAATSAELPLKERKEFPLLGKQAPEIILPDHKGRQCSLHATMQLGRPIILFFFPLAGSPHCTKESCLFRDALGLTPIFSDLQAIVIGISQDPPERSSRFVDEHQLGYRILHDEKRHAMETYGVSRTMMGMVDMRSTFIIDPSGVVRGVAEGVLNSSGHLKFAEKWLIRLEHELSERSRQYLEYSTTEGDLIAGMDKETEKMIRVVYGDQGSASFGGIDGAPRYGATSSAPTKAPLSPSGVSGRGRKNATEDDEVALKERMKKREKVAGGLQDKNMWKSWKYLLSQLSSPDDVPPPAVNGSGAARGSDKGSIGRDGKEASASPNGSIRSKKSTWSSRSNPTKALSRRSKSSHGKRMNRTQDSDAPPIPLSPRVGEGQRSLSRHRTDSIDVDSDREGATNWGTDASLESTLSTAPSSYISHNRQRTGSLSSRASKVGVSPQIGSGNGSNGNGNGFMQSMPQLAKPSVTSEVLMGDAPIVTQIVSNKVVPSTSSNSSSSSNSTTTGMLFNNYSRESSNSGKQTSSGLPSVQRLRAESTTTHQPRRSRGPSDVPEDAKPEDEEVVSMSPKRGLVDLQDQHQRGSPLLNAANKYSDPATLSRPVTSSSTVSSRPSSATGRRGKRVPPPVVSNTYSNVTTTPPWDSHTVGYDRRDSAQSSYDSDLTIRPLQEITRVSNPPNKVSHQRSLSSQSHRSIDSATGGGEGGGSNGSNKIDSTHQQRHLPPFSSRGVGKSSKQRSVSTPTNNGNGLSGNNPWVLQSLHSANTSQISLSESTGSHGGSIPMLDSTSGEDGRIKMIPRKAAPVYPPPPTPPPKHALPLPPTTNQTKPILSSSPESSDQHHNRSPILANGIPVPQSRSSISSSHSIETNSSPNHPFLISSFPSNSRRPSLAESIRSNGTFG